jgi:hypothetical protein
LASDAAAWSVADVGVWLEAIGCGAARAAFAEHQIFGAVLLVLREDDMEKVMSTGSVIAGRFGLGKMVIIARDWLLARPEPALLRGHAEHVPRACCGDLSCANCGTPGCSREAALGGEVGGTKGHGAKAGEVGGSLTVAPRPPHTTTRTTTPRRMVENAQPMHVTQMRTGRRVLGAVCAANLSLALALPRAGYGCSAWFLSWLSFPLFHFVKLAAQTPC